MTTQTPNMFNCPSCGGPLQVVVNTKSMRCKYCNNSVVIPKELRERSKDPTTIVAGYKPFFSKGCLNTMLVVTVIGLLLLAGLAIGGYYWVRNATKDIPGLSSITSGFASRGITFGSKGIGTGMFQDARSVAVDSGGNIAVGDFKDGRVQIFDPSGKYVSTFVVGTGEGVDALSISPKGVIYVAHDRIVSMYDKTGQELGAVEGAEHSSALAVGADGSLYILTNDDQIKRFDPNGKLNLTVKNAFRSVLGQSESQQYIAADGQGNIFIVGPHSNMVLKYTSEGKYVNQFGGEAPRSGKTIPGTVFNASGVGVDGYGRVFLSDWNDDIQVFSNNGTFIQSVDALTLGLDTVIFGMTVDNQNKVYLAAGDKVMQINFAKPDSQ